MTDYYLIAEIKSISGAHGFIEIVPYSDSTDRFFDLKRVFVEVFGAKRSFIVENVEIVDNSILLKFENFDSSDDVEFLLGKKIFVDEENSVKLGKDEYFIHDLIGCKVYKGSDFIGEIIEVMSSVVNDIYVVKDLKEQEFLIPAVKKFILDVDTERKILKIAPDIDLFYDDES